jgi:hypothetical protein
MFKGVVFKRCPVILRGLDDLSDSNLLVFLPVPLLKHHGERIGHRFLDKNEREEVIL